MNFFDLIAPIYDKLPVYKTISVLNEFGNFQKTDRILDLGGGTGRVSKFFINKVQEITVIDSSPRMIRKCQRNQKIICKLGSAEKVPFPDNYFDKLIIIDAFHHFQNQERACQEVKRVLKPEGIVLVEEFNPKKISGWLITKIEKLLRMSSIFHTPESLSYIFSRYFSEIKLSNNHRTTYYLIGKKI